MIKMEIRYFGHLQFTSTSTLENLINNYINKHTGTYKIKRTHSCTVYKSIPKKQGMIDETRLGCITVTEE